MSVSRDQSLGSRGRDPALHTWLDNLQGEVSGVLMIAFGVCLLKGAGLITGQIAGLALLGAYASDLSFGLLFFLANLPFFIFAYLRLGGRFTLKSLLAILAISVLGNILPDFVRFTYLEPLLAAVMGGLISGIGLIMLFRHGCSCGGIGMFGLYAQEHWGIRAGWIQLGFDAVLFSCAFWIMEPSAVIPSLIGAVVLNFVIGWNHRRDRYIGR